MASFNKISAAKKARFLSADYHCKPSSEYSIATSHNNGEVHIQWLEVVGEGAVVPNYQYERSNYPAVQMTEKVCRNLF